MMGTNLERLVVSFTTLVGGETLICLLYYFESTRSFRRVILVRMQSKRLLSVRFLDLCLVGLLFTVNTEYLVVYAAYVSFNERQRGAFPVACLAARLEECALGGHDAFSFPLTLQAPFARLSLCPAALALLLANAASFLFANYRPGICTAAAAAGAARSVLSSLLILACDGVLVSNVEEQKQKY